MAQIGSLVVPVSADVQGLQKGLKQAGREIKGFSKSIGGIEKFGILGIAGAVGGGGALGFALSKLDQEAGITEGITEKIKEAWQALAAMIADTTPDITQQLEDMDKAASANAKSFQKTEQSLRMQLLALRDGAEAAELYKLKMEGLSGTQQKVALDQFRAVQAQRAWNDLQDFAGKTVEHFWDQERFIGMNADAIAEQKAIERIQREVGEQKLRPEAGLQMEKDIRAAAAASRVARQDDEMARRIQNELDRNAASPVGAMLKGGTAEFSALQKLRRELAKDEKDMAADEVVELRKRLEKDDAKREKQLDDIKAALKDPPIKQVKM